MQDVIVRLATHADAEALTALAMKSKASWGYSREFMEACRAELTITPDVIDSWRIWVAQRGKRICGMIALAPKDEPHVAELEDFFVDPEFQAQGVGSLLMSTLLATCRSLCVRRLVLDADPFAETIYHRLGFKTVGTSPSRSIPGRMLPRMELYLA
jgi:GNAT superfamily N-acetyltransferase